MAADGLCIGDHICLYSEEVYGFVYGHQSSLIHKELAVQQRQHREKPDIKDPQVITFEVCVANRYKLNKKYRKVKGKSDAAPDDIHLKTQAAQTKVGADAENEDNIAEQRRQSGKKVLYGQIIQLRHTFTNKYVHVSTTQTSITESSNMQVEINECNAKQAQFKIMPRYKVKSEGDMVQVEDQIVLESCKSPGQFLHVSKGQFGQDSVYKSNHELNLSVRQSGFTMYRRYKPEKGHESFLKAGIPIRLFHKEIEAYLVAEGLFDDKIAEDVHLRMRPMDQNNPKTLFPSTSAITYWQIEMQDGPINGSIIRWEQQCRFKHMTTRCYLSVKDGKVSLTSDHLDPNAVFRIHPVIKEKEEIEFETYCRMEHVVSNTWLHASNTEYVRREIANIGKDDTSMAALQWTTAQLKEITVTEEMQYDDAFTIQAIEIEHINILNYMAGMVPFIQKLIQDKRDGMTLNAKHAFDIVTALLELKDFMIVNSVPNKERQKLLRNLRVVELLVSVLQISYRGTQDSQHLVKIIVESYDVLYTYLMGNSRKNELYIAKHVEFFESQISYEGEIGLNAAHMVMELVKDNRKIVDRITHKHINNFVELLKKNKNYRYLDLLSVLCVCDGVSIPDNQKYITEAWLMQGKNNCVYHTELGQAIKKEHNVVYVSKDNRRTWIPLSDFVAGKNLKTDEEFLFLDHQLDLFRKLCHGRNDFAIKVITEQLGYLTWDEAFLCLTNDQLPDQLRAKYCSLIIVLFVDVGENTSVLERINLTFLYDDIGQVSSQVGDEQDALARERSVTKKFFPQLRDWIANFMEQNKDMTAQLIGHNLLVEQVIRLVHYLVKFGFYGDLNDVQQLMGPLLSLLDGRNDKPYPNIQNKGNMKALWEKFRTEDRYKQSPETKAIVDAKYRAMEVLDLFFNFRFNTRLERFIDEFKVTYNQANNVPGGNPELGALLYENYDIYENSGTNQSALKSLNAIFTASSFFHKIGIDLTEILLDLSHYDYETMVTGSMSLLNRYFSAYDNLFKRAVQAQVLITDKSKEVLIELRKILPVMLRLKNAKMTQEQTENMGQILDKLIGFCSLENETEERHPMNQSILYNHDVLSAVFDILTQEIDIRLMETEQYSGTRNIFRKSFKLLQVMARGNVDVQQRLFDRLDMLLNIQGAENEMAECLTEVFTGNKQTCMKILPSQVSKIMSLVSQHTNKAPQFLDLLNAIVKVEELNLPLKRNQGYVMKYFMQYRSEVAYVIDQDPAQRRQLLAGGDTPDLQYMIYLVDLLATCAEGENRFIESICQTIFSVDELLEILNDRTIDNNLKRPYLRFFLWVYLNTAGGMIESGAGDLPHDTDMWAYIKSLAGDLKDICRYAKDNSETVKQLLKKSPGKSENGQGDAKSVHGSLHYILDAVMPFLQVFFHSYYQPDRENYPKEADHVDEIANSLVEFTNAVGQMISNQTHMKTMVSCMNVILSASTLPVKDTMILFNWVMEEFQEKYSGSARMEDIRSDARKLYDEEYAREEELNDQLNVFAVNFSTAYGGFNEVKAQIGFNSDREYTEIDGDEELPLGKEFQDHINVFIQEDKKDPRERYCLLSKLIQQMAISAAHTQMSEKDRLNQETLDIKCLQLLRGAIHNEIIKLPDDWESNVKANKKRIKRIMDVQNALNDHNAMLQVLPHLAKTSDDIVRNVLGFLAAMLFGGNEDVQESLIQYFLGTREEKFFFAVKNRINLSAAATKEKRSLMAQHQAKLDEALEQAKALQKAMKSGKMAARKRSQQLKHRYGSQRLGGSRASLRGSQHLQPPGAKGTNGSLAPPGDGQTMEMVPVKPGTKGDKQPLIGKDNKVAPQDGQDDDDAELDEADLEELAYMKLEESGDFDYKDEGYIELVLKIMGLMCDGQNSVLQNYLREQPDNIKSVNLVAETARFLAIVYSNINKKTMGLVTELFQTLVEFTSGNVHNQMVVFDNKVCDYINFILRGAQFQGCNKREIWSLKKVIASVITALTEESIMKPLDIGHTSKSSTTLAVEVVEALDAESIWHVAMDCYEKAQDEIYLSSVAKGKAVGAPKDAKAKMLEDEKEFILGIGFKYFHILQRMIDLDEENKVKKAKFVRYDDDRVIWDYYEGNTLSIEVLKADDLQKLYFRCKDQSVLREEVKEKFKYEVDRSSPSNKLREFMDWSKDIMADIKYTRKVLGNMLTRFFVKHWFAFNMGMITISFLFFLLIMITWQAPQDPEGSNETTAINNPVPVYAYNPEAVFIITIVLGVIHNIFSFCVLISYFITNHPTFPRFIKIWRYCRRRKDDDDDEEEEEDRKSNLEVRFFSFQTFWYIFLFAASIVGTIFYGYTFCVHLIHMAMFNQLLKRAIQAVTKNGLSLAWVFVYGIVFVYIYALIAFAVLREIFNPVSGHYCDTFYQCMVTSVHRGIIDGLYNIEFLEVPDGMPFSYHAYKAIFDISFFIIITTIGLNIIFGIIVDTFSELRDNKWNVDNDMHSCCFICSRNSYDFEHQGGGFEHHVKREHNKWAYLFFFIHLDETRPNDYTALELYVNRLLEKENYDFFPLNRALSLQHEEDSNEVRLETLMEQVSYLVNKMKEEEITKQRQEERQKQMEWEKQNKL